MTSNGTTGSAGPVEVPAAGGAVFRMRAGEPEVLLIYRKGVWDLPKGKKEEGESYPMAAVREVAEETGSEPPMIVGNLLVTYHDYVMNEVEYSKHTRWYAMISRSNHFSPQLNEQIEKVCWIGIGNAEKLVGYDNLRLVLADLRRLLKSA
ncbi:MAG: NUDIX hydrolase [Cyclonatronaceae bacterium]